jgi:predicted amidohydrolase YtcJ
LTTESLARYWQTCEPAHVPSPTVFVNGRVVTGDRTRPRAHALAVVDGRVAALDTDAVALIGSSTDVVDLAGGALLPAFGDGHVHPLWGGVDLANAPVRDATSVDDLLDRLAAFADAHPDREWITGGGFSHALSPDGLYDAALLDKVVPDRPVLLTASDYHTAWCNSLALERAGVTAETPDPDRGQIVRRVDGSPLGTLLETACELVERVAPQPTQAERIDGLAAAMRMIAESGITWVQEAALAPPDVTVYLTAASRGLLTARVNVALVASPRRWRNQLDEFRTAREAAARSETGLVRIGTVKFFADGVIESGTAALLEPYADAPHSCGLPNWEPGALAEAMAAFDALSFQSHIHAIGDAGVRNALDAVEYVTRVNGERDRRPVIAHTQLVHPQDLPRFAALGVIANFEPLWAQLDPIMVDLTLPRLGEPRNSWQYPMRTLQETGARLSFGSDWPVTSVRPLDGLAVAISRQTRTGDPPGGWLPEQRLSFDTALAAYTAGVAFQGFVDSDSGRLTVGRRADLCHLETDIADLPPLEIAGVPVLGTWLAGSEVFRR